MPYSPHFLLQFGGTVGAANPEIWSCGIRLWSEDYGGLDEQGYLEDVAVPALATWFANPLAQIGAHCDLKFAKFNLIGPDGNYGEPGVTHEFYWPANGIAGGGSATPLPYQAAVVLSWRTNERTRGPASKGRIYSPAPDVSITPETGLFNAGTAQEMADTAATLLNTLDVGIAGDVLRPSIMSSIGAAHSQIDYVVVDNRVDIQRRRANQLVPVSSTAPVTY